MFWQVSPSKNTILVFVGHCQHLDSMLSEFWGRQSHWHTSQHNETSLGSVYSPDRWEHLGADKKQKQIIWSDPWLQSFCDCSVWCLVSNACSSSDLVASDLDTNDNYWRYYGSDSNCPTIRIYGDLSQCEHNCDVDSMCGGKSCCILSKWRKTKPMPNMSNLTQQMILCQKHPKCFLRNKDAAEVLVRAIGSVTWWLHLHQGCTQATQRLHPLFLFQADGSNLSWSFTSEFEKFRMCYFCLWFEMGL